MRKDEEVEAISDEFKIDGNSILTNGGYVQNLVIE
jgi:hypothetical protein